MAASTDPAGASTSAIQSANEKRERHLIHQTWWASVGIIVSHVQTLAILAGTLEVGWSSYFRGWMAGISCSYGMWGPQECFSSDYVEHQNLLWYTVLWALACIALLLPIRLVFTWRGICWCCGGCASIARKCRGAKNPLKKHWKTAEKKQLDQKAEVGRMAGGARQWFKPKDQTLGKPSGGPPIKEFLVWKDAGSERPAPPPLGSRWMRLSAPPLGAEASVNTAVAPAAAPAAAPADVPAPAPAPAGAAAAPASSAAAPEASEAIGMSSRKMPSVKAVSNEIHNEELREALYQGWSSPHDDFSRIKVHGLTKDSYICVGEGEHKAYFQPVPEGEELTYHPSLAEALAADLSLPNTPQGPAGFSTTGQMARVHNAKEFKSFTFCRPVSSESFVRVPQANDIPKKELDALKLDKQAGTAASAPVGLLWNSVGCARPTHGEPLVNHALADLLARDQKFTFGEFCRAGIDKPIFDVQVNRGYAGLGIQQYTDRPVVAGVDSAVCPLRAGDRVLSIDGNVLAANALIGDAVKKMGPLKPMYTFRVERSRVDKTSPLTKANIEEATKILNNLQREDLYVRVFDQPAGLQWVELGGAPTAGTELKGYPWLASRLLGGTRGFTEDEFKLAGCASGFETYYDFEVTIERWPDQHTGHRTSTLGLQFADAPPYNSIQAFVQDTPADQLYQQGQLVRGDVVTAINGHQVQPDWDVQTYLSRNTKPILPSYKLRIRRQGVNQEVLRVGAERALQLRDRMRAGEDFYLSVGEGAERKIFQAERGNYYRPAVRYFKPFVAAEEMEDGSGVATLAKRRAAEEEKDRLAAKAASDAAALQATLEDEKRKADADKAAEDSKDDGAKEAARKAADPIVLAAAVNVAKEQVKAEHKRWSHGLRGIESILLFLAFGISLCTCAQLVWLQQSDSALDPTQQLAAQAAAVVLIGLVITLYLLSVREARRARAFKTSSPKSSERSVEFLCCRYAPTRWWWQLLEVEERIQTNPQTMASDATT